MRKNNDSITIEKKQSSMTTVKGRNISRDSGGRSFLSSTRVYAERPNMLNPYASLSDSKKKGPSDFVLYTTP